MANARKTSTAGLFPQQDRQRPAMTALHSETLQRASLFTFWLSADTTNHIGSTFGEYDSEELRTDAIRDKRERKSPRVHAKPPTEFRHTLARLPKLLIEAER